MSNILSYSSLTTINFKIESRFGGSSKYKLIDGELIETGGTKKEAKPKYCSTVSVEPNYEFESSVSTEERFKTVELDKRQDEPKETVYQLNKSKIKKKCIALSRLAKSKKFLAFYTISFPVGLSDDHCYQVFNTWLTRCRKDKKLSTYVWVAERQKNETIHFHMLTNDNMQIRIVNGYMAIALTTFKRKGIEALQGVNPEKYNGVHVKRVKGSRKSVIGYLVKYISKNDLKFYRLPWHCSRDISSLFISENFDKPGEKEELDRLLPDDPEKYSIFENEHYTVKGFKFSPPEILFTNLDTVNEIIYHQNN